MSKSYQNSETALKYLEFTRSKNGQIQQEVLFQAILNHLPPAQGGKILDAACGGGWLAEKLAKELKTSQVQGCDFSSGLIKDAKQNFPELTFQVADLTSPLPYPEAYFQTVILNMAAHDINNLNLAFQNISRVTEPNGNLIITIANPYYAFPVGVWKRGWLNFLLRRKPVLKLRSYFAFKNKTDRSFGWNGKFNSYFYTLPEYIQTARAAGFGLETMEDIQSLKDDPNFNMRYQLFRFPTMLLLVFKKLVK